MVSQQSTSPLLRLPAELRNKVYAYVFSGCRLRVLCHPGGSSVYATDPDSEIRFDESGRKDFKTLIALTRTCHLVYAESRLLPYKLSTYRIELVLHFTFWFIRLEKAMQDAVWEALNTSQRLYVQEVRDERGW